MAVIGVTRNVRLRRRGASGFGFSLRGGREYAAGFYVSDVQPGSEAHRNGLRVNSKFESYNSPYNFANLNIERIDFSNDAF